MSEYLFERVLLLEDKGTGRTTLRRNHMTSLDVNQKMMLGVDFGVKTLTLKNVILGKEFLMEIDEIKRIIISKNA